MEIRKKMEQQLDASIQMLGLQKGVQKVTRHESPAVDRNQPSFFLIV